MSRLNKCLALWSPVSKIGVKLFSSLVFAFVNYVN